MTEKIVPTTYAEVQARYPAELAYMVGQTKTSRSKSAKDPLDTFQWGFYSNEYTGNFLGLLRGEPTLLKLGAYIFASKGRFGMSSRFYNNLEYLAVTPPEVLEAWGRTSDSRMSDPDPNPRSDKSDEEIFTEMGFTKL